MSSQNVPNFIESSDNPKKIPKASFIVNNVFLVF